MKNVAERSGAQMAIWRVRIACWIPKAKNPHSEHLIRSEFPLQTRLNVTSPTHSIAVLLRTDITSDREIKINISITDLFTNIPSDPV